MNMGFKSIPCSSLLMLAAILLPVAQALTLHVSEKVMFVSAIDRDAGTMDCVAYLQLSWDGTECVSDGVCLASTHIPDPQGDEKPYDLPFLLVQGAADPTSIVVSEIKNTPLNGNIKAVLYKIKAKMRIGSNPWTYPFGTVGLAMQFSWDRSSYRDGDVITATPCAQAFHANVEHVEKHSFGSRLPVAWSLDTRCSSDETIFVQYGTNTLYASTSDATQCTTTAVRPYISYNAIVTKDIMSSYWFQTWLPIQALILSMLVTATFTITGSEAHFNSNLQAYLIGFLALFSKTTYKQGAFDINTLYMSMAVFSHTMMLVLMGYGVRKWGKVNRKQFLETEALQRAIDENDISFPALVDLAARRRVRAKVHQAAPVMSLLRDLGVGEDVFENFGAHEVDLKSLKEMTLGHVMELGVNAGSANKLKIAADELYSKLMAGIDDSHSGMDVVLDEKFKTDDGPVEINLVKADEQDDHAGAPCTLKETTELMKLLTDQHQMQQDAYQEKMRNRARTFVKVYSGCYLFTILLIVVVLTQLPCEKSPDGTENTDWYGRS